MVHETNSNNLIIENTSDGYIENVKLEGKTLVNLSNIYNKSNLTPSFNSNGYSKKDGYFKADYGIDVQKSVSIDEKDIIKQGKTYTFIIDIKENTLNKRIEFYPMFWDYAKNIKGSQFVNVGEIGLKIVTLTATKDYSFKIGYKSTSNNADCTGILTFGKIMVLEGDHTQNPPSYFEGLKSVGQSATTSEDEADEIVVSSVKSDGNLIIDDDINLYIPQNGAKVEKTTEGIRAYNRVTGEDRVFLQPFRVRQGSKVTISFDVKVDTEGSSTLFYISFLDVNFNVIATNLRFPTKIYTTSFERLTKTFDVGNAKYIRIELVCFGTSAGATYKNIMVSNHSKPYTPYQSDKKRLLYYNNETQSWEKPVLREWDTIEKHSDGKYYYHQRSGEVVLNGSENWGGK